MNMKPKGQSQRYQIENYKITSKDGLHILDAKKACSKSNNIVMVNYSNCKKTFEKQLEL